MKTTAAMDLILAENALINAEHARQCAIMSLGGISPDGEVSALMDSRPMGWKARNRVDASIVPPIERNQWAREARTFLGSFATQPIPGDLAGLALLELTQVGVTYTKMAYAAGSPTTLELTENF